MTDKMRELFEILATARRQKGLTQSELARQAECKQSAISMMERGHSAVLSPAKLKSIGEILDVDISPYLETSATTEITAANQPSGTAVCPVFDCPTNTPFVVNGHLRVLPRPHAAGSSRYCAYCGELLERECPECGAPIIVGRACCDKCGHGYIAVPEKPENKQLDWQEWADQQRARLVELGLS